MRRASPRPSAPSRSPPAPPPTTLAAARAVAARFRLELSAAVAQALCDPKNESPKPGQPPFERTSFAIVARPADSLNAAAAAVRKRGYDCVPLGDRIEGEARDIAAAHAHLARQLREHGRPVVILSVGE